MGLLELFIYLLIFTGVSLLVIVPAIRWSKYNMSMVLKQRLTVGFAIVLGVVGLLLFLYSLL